ncbi:E3 ubiquitin-protein ligase TRIM17-like [Stegastes partitus]|uniref:E3 ubiquitin-protein ligase TRIM17-like n=1 Tax=Stegastes partitus TaxID=144197 RepID=A0A9Y4JVA1_9TELE|nr:PREDICTED: E3 ubiquitin-protein ligase TRIM17-like [Stegastes partitus]
MADTLDVNQFRCSICLEPYTDPVSIPCGHNFCKLCIEKFWDTSERCCCPLCMEAFYRRPELRVNYSFRDVVNLFKNPSPLTSRKGSEARAGDVACDVCTDVKLKATKSCLVCLVSYCETHLEPHKTAAGLSRHKLIEPVRNLEDRICKKHEKVLEMFCKKEEKFICQICAQTEHSRHQVLTSEAASQQKMIQVKRRGREVELMIQDRQKRIEEINRSKIQTHENARRQMETSVKVFTSVIDSIRKTHKELTEEIEARHNAEQKRFEELIAELRKEIDELEKKNVELQQLSHIEDHISLLQAFSKAHALPPTQNWPSIPVNEVDFLDYIRTSLIRAREFMNVEIKQQAATELRTVQKFAEDISIDADTAGPWLLVSEDGREVRQSPKKQRVPASMARFTENTFAVATRAFSTGRHYWEVWVTGKFNWLLGLASDSLRRSEHVAPCPENGLWTVGLRDGAKYFASTKNPSRLTLPFPLQRVGVFVDYEERQVSFFNALTMTHIFTFTKCKFTAKVYPVFDPCLAPEKKEMAPLKITMVEITK